MNFFDQKLTKQNARLLGRQDEKSLGESTWLTPVRQAGTKWFHLAKILE